MRPSRSSATGGALDYFGTLAWQTGVALRRGDLAATEDLWRTMLALKPTSEVILPFSTALHHAADALIDRGRPNEAKIATGRLEDGLRDLRATGKLLEAVRFFNPNYFPWRSTLALAQPTRDRDEAHELIETELDRAAQCSPARTHSPRVNDG